MRRLRSSPIGLFRALALLTATLVGLGAQAPSDHPFALTPEVRVALDRIDAASLRGHLSFIASDLLQGRDTPSPGLDIAAEYIAAQFRRTGLEPVGDDGYFQTARWRTAEPDLDGFELALKRGKKIVRLDSGQISVPLLDTAIDLRAAPVVKVLPEDVTGVKAEQVAGKVVLTELTTGPDRGVRGEAFRRRGEFLGRMEELHPALVVVLARGTPPSPISRRLVDPENRPSADGGRVPSVTVGTAEWARVYDSLKPGHTGATLTAHLGASIEKPVRLCNVIGLLRGSDPVLKDTYVLVTGHYDHLGARVVREGDGIFNGANDDGSGTVSVIELAGALATLKVRPKRSLVFMTFFGEEKGLLGSRYYGRKPVFPIAKTVADVNLEQVGRTDSSEGPQVGTASLTGFDFSDIGTTLQAAGELMGVQVYKHPRNSDSYFGRSDNQALADQGVPAHTLCVAFAYPDYHGVGDHWEKIDYENMAKVDRTVALGLLMIADNPEEPHWNAANPRTQRYLQAWKERHPR
jgi:Peptidase family M28